MRNLYSTRVSYAVVFAFILLSIMASCAQADIVLGVGKSVVALEPLGTWRQDTFEFDANTRSDSWMIGVESGNWRLAYHAWGRATLAAGYLSGGDNRYIESSANHCDGKCPATNWAFSYQEAKGFEVSRKFSTAIWGINPYVRAGAVYYRVVQQTNVPDQGEADNPDSYRRSFAVYNMARNGFSGMYGAGISLGHVSLEINAYPSVRAKDAAFRSITETMLTVAVPF